MKAGSILPSEHVFIPGMTGTGKSYLAERYLATYPHVSMLDSKGEMQERLISATTNTPDSKGRIWKKHEIWTGVPFEEITFIEHLSEIEYADTPKIVYSPVYSEMNIDYYNEYFRWVYFRKNNIAWVDEAMEVSKNSQTIPEFYKAILTRGRSRNTAVWTLTQRPKELAPIIMSQSTHFFVFNLRLEQDREKVAAVTGAPEFRENPGKRKFWYFQDGWTHPILAELIERG